MKRRWCVAALAMSVMWMLPAHGQSKAPRLTFEVASIKPSHPDSDTIVRMIRALPGGNGYTAQNMSVKVMISLMYRVPTRQIEGGPDWLDTAYFDIEARADHAYSLDDLHVMFQNLLADRFHLKFHVEKREGNVYALTVDPAGVKMKVNDSVQDFNIPMTPGPDHSAIGSRVPMSYLAWWLGQSLQDGERSVVDMTGLTKNYDFTLKFRPALPPDIAPDQLPAEMRDLPSLFDALRQQLGLRLQAQKGPVEYYVIDGIDKPTAN